MERKQMPFRNEWVELPSVELAELHGYIDETKKQLLRQVEKLNEASLEDFHKELKALTNLIRGI